MVTCVVYASDGSVQPSVSAPSINPRSGRVVPSPPLTVNLCQSLWERTGSEYVEYRDGEQQHTPAEYEGEERLCAHLSTSPALTWRAVLEAVLARLPSLFSHSPLSEATSPASRSTVAAPSSSAFSYALFDPHALYCGSDSCSEPLSESTFSYFYHRCTGLLRLLVCLLSIPLSLPTARWLRDRAMSLSAAQSSCSPLCRSLAVLMLVVLAVISYWRWVDVCSEQSDVSAGQPIDSQPVTAAAVAVSASRAHCATRSACSDATFHCPFWPSMSPHYCR